MPTRFRPGTGQLNMVGVPKEIIEEFKTMCKGAGKLGKDLTYGELFVDIFTEWKALRKFRKFLSGTTTVSAGRSQTAGTGEEPHNEEDKGDEHHRHRKTG